MFLNTKSYLTDRMPPVMALNKGSRNAQIKRERKNMTAASVVESRRTLDWMEGKALLWGTCSQCWGDRVIRMNYQIVQVRRVGETDV